MVRKRQKEVVRFREAVNGIAFGRDQRRFADIIARGGGSKTLLKLNALGFVPVRRVLQIQIHARNICFPPARERNLRILFRNAHSLVIIPA